MEHLVLTGQLGSDEIPRTQTPLHFRVRITAHHHLFVFGCVEGNLTPSVGFRLKVTKATGVGLETPHMAPRAGRARLTDAVDFSQGI